MVWLRRKGGFSESQFGAHVIHVLAPWFGTKSSKL